MSVVPKADLLKKFKEIVGDDTSDAILEFMGDVSDTLDDAEKRTNSDDDWKKKYEDNDKMWREKYRDRFMQGSDKPDEQNAGRNANGGNEDDNEPQLKTSYDDLFTTKGE